MPADFSVYRADVQTGPAADAAEHFLEVGVGQDSGAAVVNDNQMKFPGPAICPCFPNPPR